MSKRITATARAVALLLLLSACGDTGTPVEHRPAVVSGALEDGNPGTPYLLTAPGTRAPFNMPGESTRYVRLTVPAGEPDGGLRIAVRASTDATVYVRRTTFDGGIIASGSQATMHTFFFEPGAAPADADWWLDIRTLGLDGATVDAQADTIYARPLGWDSGATLLGTAGVSRPPGGFGDFLYQITAQTSVFGVWRNALRVTTGEAHLYLQPGSFPPSYTSYKSENPGDDAYPLNANEFQDNQLWYVRVGGVSGDADWTLVSGDIHVEEFGPLTDNYQPRTLTMDVGGVAWFRTTATAQTKAWRVFAPGSTLYFDNTSAPFVRGAYSVQDLKYDDEALIVPDYLQAQGYIVAVANVAPIVQVDSRNHLVIDPLTFPGSSGGSFQFTLDDGDDGGYGYRTYKVVVPVQQIAWEITATPTLGDVDLYVAKGKVPSPYENDAMSEAVGITDAISMVPPSLTDDTFYVTVHGQAPFALNLTSGNPDIPEKPFVNDPTVIVNDAAHQGQVGWRYYVTPNVAPPLGTLGWILELENQVPGTEIAIRRNAVPGRWLRRDAGTQYATDHVEAQNSSTLGFLERPNHPTDVWYIGIYQPAAPLGAFSLRTRQMLATDLDFNAGVLPVTQASGRRRYFKVTVPNTAQGWDLRVTDDAAGRARMVVRGELLAEHYTNSTAPYPLGIYFDWQTGYQWAPTAEFTQRPYSDIDGSAYIDETAHFLLAGMGNPLRQGVFYVLVGDTWTTANPGSTLSYTIRSSGIGAGGSWTNQIATLSFDDGVVSKSDRPPRAIDFYKVVVPAGAKSWYVELEPTAGDAMMSIKKGGIPNLETGWNASSDENVATGNLRRQPDYDLFYRYPDYNQTELSPGTYYVAVGSEGVVPANNGRIYPGTTTSYTLTSHGEVDVAAAGTLTLETPYTFEDQTLRYGEQKSYRVTAPADTSELEVRLVDTTGAPYVQIASGLVQPSPTQTVTASEGGHTALGSDYEVFTVPAAAGSYTLVVSALSDPANGQPVDATYDLVVTPRGAVTLDFNDGSLPIDQDSQTWKYFKVVVPADALGWDLRLEGVSEGARPRISIRRDDKPTSFQTTYQLQLHHEWLTSEYWTPTADLTQRYMGPYVPTGTIENELGRRVSMGLGSPLSPGTYWVGVSDSDQQQTGDPFSYEIVSRGIGEGTGALGLWSMQVETLDFDDDGDGGHVSTKTLAARDNAYYRVTVPAGVDSWDLELEVDPEVSGEAMMALEKTYLPNADAIYFEAGGSRRQKLGRDYFYRFADSGQTAIPAGTYFVAVGSEGQDPYPSGTYIGTGSSTFTLTSRGELDVDEAAAPLTTTPIEWTGQSVRYGAVKAYRFEVDQPADQMFGAIEVRFLSKTGAPRMSLGEEHLPSAYWTYYNYNPVIGGHSAIGTNDVAVSIADPAGTYTILVAGDATSGGLTPDATFTLQVAVVDPTLGFNGGSRTISGQESETWRYFKVIVPATALGWDLRLEDVAPGTQPQMVIRRDEAPTYFGTTYQHQLHGEWLTGEQWAVVYDLTARPYGPYVGGGEEYLYGRRISMGMGAPLSPGTYFVGVSSNSSSAPLGYKLVSRGIGIGKDPNDVDWAIQVKDLAFGAEVSDSSSPREIVYYRVQVPEGLESWSAELEPTDGEAMMALRLGAIPHAEAYHYYGSDDPYYRGGTRRQKNGREWSFTLPRYDGSPPKTTANGGTYYIAVGPEGQAPYSSSYIGTGSSGWKLRTAGPVPIAEGVTTIVESQPLIFDDEQAAYGQVKYYRLRVPDTVPAFEVRLEERVGDPWFAVAVNPPQQARMPYTSIQSYGGAENGHSSVVGDQVAQQIVGRTGDVTVAVYSQYTATESLYDLVVTPLTIGTLGWEDAGENVVLKDKEAAYFKVEIPQDCDGVAQAGWIVSQATTLGAVEIAVRKDTLPDDPAGTFQALITTAKETIIVPPFLEPGNWYVRVRATGSSNATITTKEVVEARHWIMPALGETASTPGLTHPYFADTGYDDDGNEIPNQGSDDLGTDLGEGRFIFYRVTVPPGNGGIFRTKLTGWSGNPELYIRRGAAPTINQMPYPYNYRHADYQDTRTVSSYGHWVRYDAKYGTELEPGEYWFSVYANGSTVRFQLSLDVGVVEDLSLRGGVVNDRQILAGDMQFFRVTMPDSDLGTAAGMPLDWTLTLNQEQGDAVVHLREDLPPGFHDLVPDPTQTSSYITDWGIDRSLYIYGYPTTPTLEVTESKTLEMPLLRPATTYWLGVFARTDVTIDLSSQASAATLDVDQIVAYDAAIVDDIPAGDKRLYRVDVPAGAGRWRHTATVNDGVWFYLSQGVVPPETTSADWYNSGYGYNSSYDRSFESPGGYVGNYPFVAGESYYLVVRNTTAISQHLDIDLDGRPYTDDSDNDTLADGWEYRWFGSLSYTETSDVDSDGLSNDVEETIGTMPNDRDSDDDDLDDGLELLVGGDPLKQDTDEDEVCDGSDSAPDDPNEAGRVIRLYMRQYEGGTYGHNHGTNEHLTRLAAVFERFPDDWHWVHIVGWDIEAVDEVAVWLNGRLLGYLPVGGDGAYSLPVMFAIDSQDLVQGSDNRLELRQKTSGETWGVKELGLQSFGSLFGADPARAFDNRHPQGFDLRFEDLSNVLLEMRAFDLDAADEVSVTVDGAPWLPAFAATGERTWSPPLQVPFAAIDVGAGPTHVLRVRPKGGSDGTWQLRIVAQRPLYSNFGTNGYSGEDGHFYQAFRFLFPKKPAGRELVLNYTLSPGRVVQVGDSARGDSTYQTAAYYSQGPNQEHFSDPAVQDRVDALVEVVDPEQTSHWFGVYLRYYGPCADVDLSGLDDCLEICDDEDEDGYFAATATCPAGDDCDDADDTIGPSPNDADCDGVPAGSDCDDNDPDQPANDADCDGYATASDCDDADATQPANDADCDGIATASDCNDNNAGMPSGDADCDGSATGVDCDDNDPAIVGACPPIDLCVDADNDTHKKRAADCPAGDDCNDGSATSTYLGIDADCDGVETGVDCDDNNPGETDKNIGDLDCDGVPSATDCNDNSATVVTTNVGDKDCDGVATAIDCNDNSASVKNTNVNDADCDLVATANDCNDGDAAVKNTRTLDFDCDRVPTPIDCNDNDANVRNINTNDVDCDLAPTAIDCDDSNKLVTNVRTNDADCDLVPKPVDCNDNDPAVKNVKTGDADCDLVPSATDCNDASAAVTNVRTGDADCDLVPTAIDCDDSSAAVRTTNVGDADCDGVGVAIDCDDANARVLITNVGDADCDRVGVAVDCDDDDPAVVATSVGDADCDGVAVAIDCDDGDAGVTATSVGDADCDRVAVAIDCDDRDASVTRTTAGDEDCDLVPSGFDCDDGDPMITTTNAGDFDCDGVGTPVDCDDRDALVTGTRAVNDWDCDGVSDPLDCGEADPDDARSRAGDADCDGVHSELDCDDRNPRNTAVNSGDADCDGTPAARDCDDRDASNTSDKTGDLDCDGAATADDCDDADPTVQVCPTCDDADGDDHFAKSATCPKGDDCDDADAGSTWREVDGDCDGARTADDCDDADPEAPLIADDGDCDGVATAEDCDDADAELGPKADDVDCDGVADGDDNCVDIANHDQADADRDGTGDQCEACALGEDPDDDGFVDACDVCPEVADDQRDTDRDGTGDACDDSDDDGLLDTADNCPVRKNADQADRDGDGIGDECDTYEIVTTSEDSSCRTGALGWGLVPLALLLWWLRRRSERRFTR